MHDTAYEHGRLFFDLYGSSAIRTVVELGSQDVNGSLRDHVPDGVHYIGIDVMVAKGVDLVVDPGAALPLVSECADAVLSSSAFEHDTFFWETFLELVRIMRPGGLLYVNVPSNGEFHRYPLDCWRFYPDAGVALVLWAAHRGLAVELLESFIGQSKAEGWSDFVAVFRKPDGTRHHRKGCIADHAPSINVHDRPRSPGATPRALSQEMPDARLTRETKSRLQTVTEENAALRRSIVTLTSTIADHNAQIAGLTAELTTARRESAAMRNSTSWRMTAGFRRLVGLVRGH